jgi:uncharacterized protein (DUF1501 family)
MVAELTQSAPLGETPMGVDRFHSTRRRFLQLSAAGLTVAGASSPWFEQLAKASAAGKKRSCILLWMAGGPSQLDTFDPKPESRNTGSTKAIPTAIPGVQFSEHLPELAKEAKRLAVIRSMTAKEGDHSRATYLGHTGQLPVGPLKYPTMGSFLSKQLGDESSELPAFVSIAPSRFFSPDAYGPGFLGSRYAPLVVGEVAGFQQRDIQLTVENIKSPADVPADRFAKRLALLNAVGSDFAHQEATPVKSHQVAYERAVRLMKSDAVKAFDLDSETSEVRDSYGRNYFGQGCLLARRLVQAGVSFVEVSLGGLEGAPAGWDNHQDIFSQIKVLNGALDKGFATLLRDLASRGLLETTTIVWMGEFGRTPRISNGGRDHFPTAYSTILAGGGIKGGQVVGRTSASGEAVADRPVQIIDFLATICKAVGVDPAAQNVVDERPIRLVDLKAKPVSEVLA